MGFLINCSNCRPRSYHEFRFGGEMSASDDISRLWLRRNVAGEQVERWFHEAGCWRWSTHPRETMTNTFLSAADNVLPLPLDLLEGA
jgi:heterotetrameric sarcosine oxidase delta subunit